MDISISAVIAQVINFGIIFWLFSKFGAKPLANAIENRRNLLAKLEHADQAYAEKIQDAEKQAEKIIAEGNETKASILNEASVLAGKKREEIIQEAEQKGETIIQDAEIRAKALEKEVEKDFEESLKQTSLLVVKKLLQSDKNLESKYLEWLVKDLQ